MTLRDLSEGLRELADDVQPADLHARAIRTSRRLRAQRAAGVMSGVLALVLVVVVGVSLSWHRTEDPGTGMDAAVGADESPSGDEASAYAQDAPPASTVLARVGYYLRETSPGVYAVLSWAQGDEPRLEISGDIEFASSVAVSPSGQYVAFYETGRLAVADIGVDATDYADVVYEAQGNGDPCAPPTWAPDSSAVVLSETGAATSSLIGLNDGPPRAVEVPRPAGCSPQLFSYGKDVATFGFASVVDQSVSWTEAETGNELARAGYDPPGLGFTLSRLSTVSADGQIACLSGEPDQIPSRVACSALATAQGPVDVKLPLDGVLTGASFLDNGLIPYGAGGDDGEDGTIVAMTSQDLMLRVRGDDGTYVSQTMVMVGDSASGDFGDVTVTGLEEVQPALLEPPSLADAYLLMYTG